MIFRYGIYQRYTILVSNHKYRKTKNNLQSTSRLILNPQNRLGIFSKYDSIPNIFRHFRHLNFLYDHLLYRFRFQYVYSPLFVFFRWNKFAFIYTKCKAIIHTVFSFVKYPCQCLLILPSIHSATKRNIFIHANRQLHQIKNHAGAD